MPVKHITIDALEFRTAVEAVQHAKADPRMNTAILLGDRHYAIKDADGKRLEADGVAFAYLTEREMPNGEFRVVTVPVNND